MRSVISLSIDSTEIAVVAVNSSTIDSKRIRWKPVFFLSNSYHPLARFQHFAAAVMCINLLCK